MIDKPIDKLIGIVVLCVVAIVVFAAYDSATAERETVQARIITTYTLSGGFLSGTPYTIFELPDGQRVRRRGIWGVPGETAPIKVLAE